MTIFYVRTREFFRGQTATEYVLVAALIAIVLYSVYTTLTSSAS